MTTVSEERVFILQEFDGAVLVNKGLISNKALADYLIITERSYRDKLEPKKGSQYIDIIPVIK